MYVELLAVTPSAEQLICQAYGICTNKAVPVGNIQKWIKAGHLSPLEHAHATFYIEGISRACLAQLTRHRLCSFSVQSMRYCDVGDKRTAWSKFTLDQEAEMLELYKSGCSTNQISVRFDCSQETVSRIVKRSGTEIRQRGDHKAGNIDLFSMPITKPEEATLLGLIFADGCLFNATGNHRVSIKMKERQMVRQAQKLFNTQSFNGLDDGMWLTTLSSKTVFERLTNEYGCFPAKSNTMEATLVEQALPKDMISHFVRGYFEGDGCVNLYYDKSNDSYKPYLAFVSGSAKFLVWLEDTIRSACNTKKKKIRKMKPSLGNAYRLQYQGRIEICNLLHWMYKGASYQIFHIDKIKVANKIYEDIERLARIGIRSECDRLGMVLPETIATNNLDSLLAYVSAIQEARFVYDDMTILLPAEDRRFVLPLATKTRLIVTANFRQWRHVIEQRCDKHAQWEIRELAMEILHRLDIEAPSVFYDLTQKYYGNE